MSGRPLAIDLFCGLGGWSEALLAEGYDVVGFDIERHAYGEHRYPGQLVVQDVLTLHGSQFRDAALIVASPPCQFFSYCAMPWTRAKRLAAEVRSDPARLERELALFNACFRIQREACEAAGRHIPLIVENVRGAIPWVGRSRWNFGSFHLWGDVPALMPHTFSASKVAGLNWSGSEKPGYVARALNDTAVQQQLMGHKGAVPGWDAENGRSLRGMVRWTNPAEGIKQGGTWWHDPASVSVTTSSKSPARKAASAMIAKIPEPLARWVATCYYPKL